jgi:protein TIF31
LTRFREILSNFKPPIQYQGINPSPSLLSTFNQNSNLKLNENTDLDHLFPFSHSLPLPQCLISLSISAWNPPPFQLKLSGDLMYLTVETLEHETLDITASTHGFYINASTKAHFDPAPLDKEIYPSLPQLLKAKSSLFEKSFSELQLFISKRDSYEYILPHHPIYPWILDSQTHVADPGRTLDSLLMASEVLDTFASKDWNDELMSAKELPKTTVNECLIRENTMFKSHAEFIEAATRGAVAITLKNILPINPVEKEFKDVYLHNNIFFTQGYESREQYEAYGGEEAYHVALGKDVSAVRWFNQMDIEGLNTLGTVVVDYKGIRTVCQSIVPGVLKRSSDAKEEETVKYGSTESGTSVFYDETFDELLKKSSVNLHLDLHTVADKNGKETSLYTSWDTKGIFGTDSRRYFIDLYRITPVDIEFLREIEKDESNPYPHQMVLLRPELIESFYEFKIRKLIQEKNKDATCCDHSGSGEHTHSENHAQISLDDESLILKFNPDVFTKAQLAGDAEKIKQQEEKVSELSGFMDIMIAQLLIDMSNYPVNIPVDGQNLTKCLHSRGINMRYLGKIATLLKQSGAASLLYMKV